MTAGLAGDHAEPDAWVHGRCYGSLDAGLSPEGREQAARLAERLTTESFAALYSSPRLRAIETAQAIRWIVTIVPEFREMDFGDFEGRTYNEIEATHSALYRQWMEAPTTVQFPNGESFTQMRERVLGAYRALVARHTADVIGVVAHGGVIRIILADVLDMSRRKHLPHRPAIWSPEPHPVLRRPPVGGTR